MSRQDERFGDSTTVDDVFDKQGFDKVWFRKKGSSNKTPRFTEEEELKDPLAPPRPEGQRGQAKGSVFTDSTYVHRQTGERVILQTVDTKGERRPGLLVPDKRETTNAQLIHKRVPTATVFLIPKLDE